MGGGTLGWVEGGWGVGGGCAGAWRGGVVEVVERGVMEATAEMPHPSSACAAAVAVAITRMRSRGSDRVAVSLWLGESDTADPLEPRCLYLVQGRDRGRGGRGVCSGRHPGTRGTGVWLRRVIPVQIRRDLVMTSPI